MSNDGSNSGARAQALTETDLKVAGAAGVEASAANSYASLADFASWIDHRAIAGLSNETEDRVSALLTAAIVVDGIGSGRFYGKRADAAQRLAWPRTGAKYDGATIAADAIPHALVQAQCAVAVYIMNGTLVVDRVVNPNSVIKKLKSGPDEIEYAIRSQDVIGARDSYNLVEDILAGLMRPADWRRSRRRNRVIAVSEQNGGVTNIVQFGDDSDGNRLFFNSRA